MGTTRALTAGWLALLLAACTSADTPQEITEGPTTVAAPTADEPATPPKPAQETATEVAPTPVEEPSPSVEVTDLATLATTDPAADSVSLDGGTYTHESFRGLAFAIPAGTTAMMEYGDSIGFKHADFAAADDIVWVVPALGIVPPDRAGVHIPHDEDPLDFALPVPDDLGAWLEAVPQAEVLDEGGGDAPSGPYAWWDVALRPELGETFSDCGHQACIHNVVDELGALIHADVWTVRYAQPAAAPGLLVWSQERNGTGPAASFVETMVASAVVP